MQHSKRIFRSFMLVYISFALCLTLLMVPLYQVSIREAEKRTLDTAGEALHAGMSVFEEAIGNVNRTADSLFNHAHFTQLAYMGDDIQPQEAFYIARAKSTYKSIVASLQMTEYTGLYLKNNSLIANGLYTRNADELFDAEIDSFYIYEREGEIRSDFEEWRNLAAPKGESLSLSQMRMGSAADGLKDMVVYSVSLPLNTLRKTNFFYAAYSSEKLFEMMVLPQYRKNCSIALYATDASKPFLNWSTGRADKYVELAYRSPLYGLKATLRIDRDVLLAQLSSFRWIMLAIVTVYIAIGIILALIYAWKNAKPMVRVIRAAQQTGISSVLVEEVNLNAWQYIHSMIDDMGREVTASRQKQELQMVQLQDSMFDRLLRGDLHSEQSMKQAQSFFPHFPACSCVILVRMLHSHKMEIEAFSAAQLQLSEILQAHLPAGVRVHFFSNLAVLVCPCTEERYNEECSNVISGLMPYLKETENLDVRFAVSTPIHSIYDLSRVFQQLRHLLHIVGENGDTVVFAQDHEHTASQENSYSSVRFYEMLLRGESAVAVSLMEEDIKRLKTSGVPGETGIQQLFFIYRHEMLHVKEELELTAQLQSPMEELPNYHPQLSLDELFAELRRYAFLLGNCITSHRQSNRDSFENRIIAYIDEHLSDTMLCVRSVIDHFSISDSTLRALLSKKTGTTFSVYVEQRRMQQAKTLVQHGQIPVSQIPQECGYASANTFYKAFKRYFGMSPSTMRSQAAESHTAE